MDPKSKRFLDFQKSILRTTNDTNERKWYDRLKRTDRSSMSDNANNDNNNRKRKLRGSEPAWTDSVSTVAAAQFGARRLPELKSLFRHLPEKESTDHSAGGTADENKNKKKRTFASSGQTPIFNPFSTVHEAAWRSGGRKTSSRHLRRRATSHKSRRTNRRHIAISATTTTTHSTSTTASATAADASNATTGTSPSVEPEPNDDNDAIDASSSSNALDRRPILKEQCRRVRRQTSARLHTFHDGWRHERDAFPLCHGTAVSNDNHATVAIARLEKDRNQIGTKQPHCNLPMIRENSTDKLNNNTNGKSNNNDHWLATHVWHAKRFRMESLWGWKVPMLHTNRGCDAAVRLSRDKCLIQDATWCTQPLWFQISPLKPATTPTTPPLPPPTTTPSYSSDAIFSTWERFQGIVQRLIPHFEYNPLGQSDHTGEGMLHRPDCFPAAAIGPVHWIVTVRHPLLAQNDNATGISVGDQQSDVFFVYFFVHPSIEQTAILHFREVFNMDDLSIRDEEILGPWYGIVGGMACFKLRGLLASECIQPGLRDMWHENASNGHWLDFWKRLNSTSVEHGQLFRSPNFSGSPSTKAAFVLRCRRPRQTIIGSGNWAVCGWDLFCHASQAKSLFVSIVVRGGACPIGQAEEAYLSLECSPSMLIFPRDYPDTEEGISFWYERSDDWRLVRKYWEGGGGRIASSTSHTPSTHHFSHAILTVFSQETCKSNVVVVRDAYTDPFRRALRGCCKSLVARCSLATSPQRRKHRGTGRTRSYVAAPRISDEEFALHHEYCTLLLQTLSLPAVLVCCINGTGRGTFPVGSGLYPVGEDSNAMGFITSSAFSVSRGFFHGIGIVVAKDFLQAIMSSRSDNTCVVRRCTDGSKSVELKVRVNHPQEVFREVTLSLLDSD